MSGALDVSAVAALTKKAITQRERGAYVRAAELFARAAAAAQALRARDCLLLASLALSQAECWALQSKSPLLARADADAMVGAAMALLPAALATLARRRAAGTLLCSACAPHEEAWEQINVIHASNLEDARGSEDDGAALPPLQLRTAAAAAKHTRTARRPRRRMTRCRAGTRWC